MATRLDYRNALKDKLLGLEDEGYGDFEFEDAELNTHLELAVARLYPAVYRYVTIEDEAVVSYGTRLLGEVETDYANRVFLVEDALERTTVTGWLARPGRIVNIDSAQFATVNLYYHDAYVMPANDDDDAGIPGTFTPLVVLGALIEALESRHDTGVRGEPPPTGPHQEVPLIDRLVARYEALRSDLAMSLPGVVV